MEGITAIDGAPLAPESIQMIEYLRTRAAEMSATAIRTRIATAARELEHTVAGVRSSEARLRPILGKWRTPK